MYIYIYGIYTQYARTIDSVEVETCLLIYQSLLSHLS